ncbi:MAG: phospholipase [Chloroflexi bacterium]|nr:phospholipase [Chloroflexota bacterium]
MDSETKLKLAHLVRPGRGEGEGAERGLPGLLLLHGRGSDEADLMGLVDALDPRLTVVSARAPYRLPPGFAWYVMGEAGYADAEAMQSSIGDLREFIDGMLPAYGIDPQRLYLMGFSQGAVMSAALSLVVPERVRGVVMHSGYVPINSGLDLQPGKIAGKGYFVAHGKYDDVIPVTFGRDAHEYLEAAQAQVTYREYPIGHSISEESLYDLSDWLTNELDA